MVTVGIKDGVATTTFQTFYPFIVGAQLQPNGVALELDLTSVWPL